MQWLTPIPEDAGVWRLKVANASPATARSVEAVAASLPGAADDRTRGTRPVPAVERRHGERRRQDRRQRQVPVLLDTRCRQDRRASGDRRSAGPVKGRRLDVYA